MQWPTGPGGCQGLSGQLREDTKSRDRRREHDVGLAPQRHKGEVEWKGVGHCMCDTDSGQETP